MSGTRPFRVLPRRYRILLRIIDDFLVLPRALQTCFIVPLHWPLFEALLPRWTWDWLPGLVIPLTYTTWASMALALITPMVVLLCLVWYFGVDPELNSMLPHKGPRVDVSPDQDLEAIMAKDGVHTMQVDEKGENVLRLRDRWVAVMIYPDSKERYRLRNYWLINIVLPAPTFIFAYTLMFSPIMNGQELIHGVKPPESRPMYYPAIVAMKPWIEYTQLIWTTAAVLLQVCSIVVDYLGLEEPRMRFVKLSLVNKDVYFLSKKRGVLKVNDDKVGSLFDEETGTLRVC